MVISFICIREKEDIPKELLEKHSSKFPQVHYEVEAMAMLVKEVSKFNGDNVCSVPFCSTVESEAFGAIVNKGDYKTGPRVKEFKYKKVTELEELMDIDFENGRIKNVLDCVKALREDRRLVKLKVVGPITILSSLLDMKTLVKGFRKKEPTLYNALETIERNLRIYTSMAIKNGADIISYADPTGNIDLVGPKFYRDSSAKTNYSVLKKLTNCEDGTAIHVCKIQSLALEEVGLLQVEKVKCSKELSYCEAMINLAQKDNNVHLFGHRCLKGCSSKPVDYLYKLNLTK